ncbi:GTPase Der [Achromatium sp. WMS2]|nr:GTPase Der [Achromatium sp. WMS2]
MLPVIVLVGRVNVGKSSLFNKLTGSRDALVADYPGLTRDRKYGVGRVGPGPYVIIDTGGLNGAADGVDAQGEKQTMQAIAEADHILLVLDAQVGCVGWDLELAHKLREFGKPVTAVVNKSEGQNPDLVVADFYQLGLGTPIPISAAHGHGVADLMAGILSPIIGDIPNPTVAADADGVAVAVVGRPNVGKSTLINRLLGEERLITFDQPGTTRDSQFIAIHKDDKKYILIDTAGVRRRTRVTEAVEKFSIIKTMQAIAQASVVLLLLDAQAGISDQDAGLAGYILEQGKGLIVVVNKWDGLSVHDRDRFKLEVSRRLGFLDFASWHYISALHGSGVGNLLAAVDPVDANAKRALSTAELNRILEQITSEHPPPLVHGRRIKLRYAHQGGRNPPTIVVHGNQTESLPKSYIRYLSNKFRQILNLSGTPVKLVFKTGVNPYKDKKNVLTLRQQKKRMRLISKNR